jgi:hypothetical protein
MLNCRFCLRGGTEDLRMMLVGLSAKLLNSGMLNRSHLSVFQRGALLIAIRSASEYLVDRKCHHGDVSSLDGYGDACLDSQSDQSIVSLWFIQYSGQPEAVHHLALDCSILEGKLVSKEFRAGSTLIGVIFSPSSLVLSTMDNDCSVVSHQGSLEETGLPHRLALLLLVARSSTSAGLRVYSFGVSGGLADIIYAHCQTFTILLFFVLHTALNRPNREVGLSDSGKPNHAR